MRPVTVRQARALRAVAASALTALLAATAHTLGGGGAPAPDVVLVAALLAMPVALAFSGRRPSIVRTALAVIGAQVVYHVVFALFGMSVAFTGQTMMHMHAAPAPVARLASTAAAAEPLMGLFEPAMLAMHAAAALITVALLTHGERLLRAIAGTVLPRLLRRTFRPLAVRTAAPSTVAQVVCIVRHAFSGVRRRGPPAFC